MRTLSSHTIQVTTPRSAAGRVSVRVDATHGSPYGISPSTSAAVFDYTAPPMATEQRAVPHR